MSKKPQDQDRSKAVDVDGCIVSSIEEVERDRSEKTPFQFIGVLHELHLCTAVDFAEVVISGFDMSCCQFAIESPRNPALVRAVSDQAVELFKRHQFIYHLSKFRNIPVFCKRVSKYLSRGYMMVGFTLGANWSMLFQQVVMEDKENEIVYDGDAVFATMMFQHLRDNPYNWYGGQETSSLPSITQGDLDDDTTATSHKEGLDDDTTRTPHIDESDTKKRGPDMLADGSDSSSGGTHKTQKTESAVSDKTELPSPNIDCLLPLMIEWRKAHEYSL